MVQKLSWLGQDTYGFSWPKRSNYKKIGGSIQQWKQVCNSNRLYVSIRPYVKSNLSIFDLPFYRFLVLIFFQQYFPEAIQENPQSIKFSNEICDVVPIQ